MLEQNTIVTRLGQLLILIAMPACLSLCSAAEQKPLVREIFVPFGDLEVVLEAAGRRVFLTRDQYEALLAKAVTLPEPAAPYGAAWLAAEYNATVEEGRARILASLSLEVAADGLQAIPLDIGGVGLRVATLNGQPAAIGQPNGHPTLFVEGRGRHELLLEMVVPVEVSAARQTMRFRLPNAATGRLYLTVPGNIEVKSGAHVVSRSVNEVADVTRLELLPPEGMTTLVMTLNNKSTQRRQTIAARNVIVDELTEAYERLHFTSSLKVIHGAIQELRFAVPESFEVTGVETPLMSRWLVNQENDSNVLEIFLREPNEEAIVLSISAQRTAPELTGWSIPEFKPLDVASCVSVVGLLVEERLRMTSLAARGLIPIDTDSLTDSLPPSVFTAEPGAPAIRPVAAYYSSGPSFDLNASFEKPESRVEVTSNTLLIVQDSGLQVRGGLLLRPIAEKIFGCNLSIEAGWHVSEITFNGQPLPFEQYDAVGTSRIRITLPRGVAPGEEYNIHFHASHTPDGWLDPWSSKEVDFPQFAVTESTSSRGAVAVQMRDDLVARPLRIEGLALLDDNQKAQFNLADVPASLAYRFERRPFALTLEIQRIEPRIAAETYSFLKVEPSKLSAHFEIVYSITDARARELLFDLPVGTPRELSITGLGGVGIKDFSSQEVGGNLRRWRVQLAEGTRGTVRIAVNFQQPLDTGASSESQEGQRQLAETLALPLVQAAGVEFQTGIIAVEGSAELEVKLRTESRKVDVGELAGAEYRPGRHLLGAFGFVGQPETVTADISRPPGYGLPAAIVQRCELSTAISANGLSQTAVRFRLRTKAQFLEVVLPSESTLWSAYQDQMPAKPQRDGQRLLISLDASDEASLRELQLAYETPVDDVGLWGSVRVLAPRLFLRETDQSQSVEVPLADLLWHVYLPDGYHVVDHDGTVYPMSGGATPRTTTALEKVAGALFTNPGGARWLAQAKVASERWSQVTTGQPDSAVRLGTEALGEIQPAEQDVDELFEHDFSFADQSAAPANPPGPAAGLDRDALSRPARGRAEVGALDGQQTPPEPESSAQSSVTVVAGKDFGLDWASRGRRSLRIELAQQDNHVTFQSLGAEPVLEIALVDQRRITMIGWSTAVVVVAIGLMLIPRPVGVKVQFIAAVVISATVLALLFSWDGPAGNVTDFAVYAALSLIPLYVVTGCWSSMVTLLRASSTRIALILIGLAITASPGFADEQFQIVTPDRQEPLTVTVVQPVKPVEVPTDAVVIPYEPDDPNGVASAEKIIVPYEKYVELWNLAYPDKKLDEKPLPAEYSLAGAEWRAELEDGDFLRLDGRIELEVFADKLVAIPMALHGGVLVAAALDGEPARIQLVQTQRDSLHQQQSTAEVARRVHEASALSTLYASGRGRKQLDLSIRYRLTRQGGWRLAEGRLPTSLANSLELLVPQSDTELRLSGVADRSLYETTQPNEMIQTTLASNESFRFQWRPKVEQATVDHGLTVESEAVLDVQEDGLRLHWDVNLKFPRGQREFFTLIVSDGFLVERVSGENVRSWESNGPQLRITLLKSARDAQKLTLELSRRVTLDAGNLTYFEAPQVHIPEALIHEGRLAVRRSPRLELRVVQMAGLSRTDSQWTKVLGEAARSPLGIRAFQAYRFPRAPFELQLSVAPTASQLSAHVQTLLRASESERTVESRIVFRSAGPPIYVLAIELPLDLQVDEVLAPGEHQWSVTPADTTQRMQLYLTEGQSGEFSVVIRGSLGRRESVETVPLPRISVSDATKLATTIVVQTDPSYDARADSLEGCQSVLLRQAHSWLAVDQRQLARLAIECPSVNFAGQVLLQKRTPRVTCQTVSNLRVTSRTFEETVLLDFTIENAGVREVTFLIPESLRHAKISAPKLRQKSIEDVEDSEQVRVRLELQDEVMGQFRVLVENERLASGEHSVSIPMVETGRTARRFVSLESAGRDEVLLDHPQGLQPLSSAQQQWRDLAQMLSGQITQAFLVKPGETSPSLIVRTKDRLAVETAGATIPLAQTVLTVDASGAFRGVQIYQVDNRTEQFLEIKLPVGARLWTARVAAQPVKAIMGNGQVRIPLVKTAEGDQDYPVELTYGGRSRNLSRWTRVDFPIVHTVNINVEESQVRLWLPETHRWLRFDGSMRLVKQEGDLIAGYLKYKTGQLRREFENVASSNPFTRMRARSNLKKLATDLEQFRRSSDGDDNVRLQQELSSNTAALQRAQEILAEQGQQDGVPTEGRDNRSLLNRLYFRQSNEISRNIVNAQGHNFATIDDSRDAAPSEEIVDQAGRISGGWFKESGLNNKLDDQSVKEQHRLILRGPEKSESGSKGSARYRARQTAPGVAAGDAIDELKKQTSDGPQDPNSGDRYYADREKLRRFGNRLEAEEIAEKLTGERNVPRSGIGGGYLEGLRVDSAREEEAEVREQFGTNDHVAQRPDGRAVQLQSQSLNLGRPLGVDGRVLATQSSDGTVRLWDVNTGTPVTIPPRATGLANLNVEVPRRGVQFLFTTPRGDVRITAHAMDRSFISRLTRLSCVLVGFTIGGLIFRQLSQHRFDAVVNRGVCLTLILIGFAFLFLGLVPIVAATAVVFGFFQFGRLTLLRWYSTNLS